MIEAERRLFEADAAPYGFDLTRTERNLGVEPWGDYTSDATGHRWAGWLAARDITAFDAEAVAWAYGKCIALGLENGSIDSAMMMDRLKLMLGGA